MECFHSMKKKKKEKWSNGSQVGYVESLRYSEMRFCGWNCGSCGVLSEYGETNKKMHCLGLLSFLINRQPSRKFYIDRGLRQGDASPLTCLFFVQMSSLNWWRRKSNSMTFMTCMWQGTGPKKFHFFSADYSMHFVCANSREIDRNMETLSTYQA